MEGMTRIELASPVWKFGRVPLPTPAFPRNCSDRAPYRYRRVSPRATSFRALMARIWHGRQAPVECVRLRVALLVLVIGGGVVGAWEGTAPVFNW